MAAIGLSELVAVYAVGGALFWDALRRHRRLRKLQDHPKSKIESAPQGLVEFEGFAWKNREVRFDLEGFEAVYYRFQVQREETKGSGKNKKKVWVTIYQESFEDPFYLVDPTGLVRILPSHSKIEVEKGSPQLWSQMSNDKKNKVVQKLTGVGIEGFPPSPLFWGLFSKRYRIVETAIHVGCPLFVNGVFEADQGANPQSTPLPGLAEFCDKVFDLKSRSLKKVDRILDANNDGKVSDLEARRGYRTAAQLAIRKAETGKTTPGNFLIHGSMMRSDHHELLIYDSHEHHALERVGRWQMARLVGGAAALTLALVLTLKDLQPDLNLSQLPTAKTSVDSAASSRSAASVSPDDVLHEESLRLHDRCLSADSQACRKLIDKKEIYQLDDKNVEYYSYVACKSGLTQYCQK